MDDFSAEDLCSCNDDSDRHIAELALAGDSAEIDALYAHSPIDRAHTALMRCRRDRCPAHTDVGDAVTLLGGMLTALESADV